MVAQRSKGGALIIVGAGGLARETAEAVRATNDDRPTYDLLGFVDDDPSLSGSRVDGVPVVGTLATLSDRAATQLVVAIGRPGDFGSRRRVVERLELPETRFASVMHPAAVVPPSIHVGAGTILLAGVVCTTAVTIGAHVAVMPCSVLTHDVVVEDYATIASGVIFGGGAKIATGAYVGAGASIREGIEIGASSLIGMGSVVTRSVPPRELWAGVPARRVRAL